MRSKIASLLLNLMVLGLLLFTSLRTLDFIQLTLPPGQKVWGYLALLAFDGGLVLWTQYFLAAAKGAYQRAISGLMIGVSLLGVILAFGIDTLYQSASAGIIKDLDESLVSNAIWATTIVIGLNVSALIGIHITDPDKLRGMAEQEAKDKVQDAALRRISDDADSLAAELAPLMAADWLVKMRDNLKRGLADSNYINIQDVQRQVNLLASQQPGVPQLTAGPTGDVFTATCDGCHKMIIGGKPRKYHDPVCRRLARKERKKSVA